MGQGVMRSMRALEAVGVDVSEKSNQPGPPGSRVGEPGGGDAASAGDQEPKGTQPFGPRTPSGSAGDLQQPKKVNFGDKEVDLGKLKEDTYVGQTVAGRFLITEFIDRGGMGEVYLGVNEALGQKVAIKFLNKRLTSDEQIVARFGNEAKSYAKVNHPHAVTLLDYGQHDDGALYIITEFVEGKPLSQTVKAAGPLSPVQVISIGQQCCDVLSAAHKQGVIHRDLKPDNIMLIPGPRARYAVKLLDFGIAKIAGEEDFRTETGAVFGTPEFMSPEQARGEPAQPESDLYALGVILYYMCSGRLPFGGKNKFSVLNQHLNDPPMRPSKKAPQAAIPATLEAVILKCLNKQTSERYRHAEDLYDALSEVYDSLESTADASTGPLHLGAKAAAAAAVQPPAGAAAAAAAAPAGGVHTTDLDVSGRHLSSPDLSPPQLLDLGPGPQGPVTLGQGLGQVDQGPVTLGQGLGQEEDPQDFEDELVQWDSSTRLDSGRARRLSTGLLLGALLVLGAWVVWTFSEPKTLPPQPDSEQDTTVGAAKEVQGGAEVDQLQVTGQVLGLLASAQIALTQGELAQAKRHLQTSELWLDDAQLPERARTERAQLRQQLGALEATLERARALGASGDCRQLRQLLPDLKAVSDPLAQRWLERANQCDQTRRAKTPAAKPPAAKPPAAKSPAPPAPKAPVPPPPPPEPPEPPETPEPPAEEDALKPDPSALPPRTL